MHPQSTEPTAGYRVAFDVMADIKPLMFPAGTTTVQIAERLHQAFLAAEAITMDDEFDAAIDFEACTVDVAVDGSVIEHGSITWLEPAPDRWLTLAHDLRQAADVIATLAGTTPPTGLYIGNPGLYLFSSILLSESDQHCPIVDRVAEAFGVTPTDRATGGDWRHEMEAEVGSLRVSAYARMPAPEDTEKAKLAARVAELEAQIAAGGAR